MRFLGGKHRISKYIAPLVLSRNRVGIIVEPFCGGLHMTTRLLSIDPSVHVLASDIHGDLIDMWKALQDGWVPPRNMSRDERAALKAGPSCPDRTFGGYACSFGGNWFAGYAEDSSGRNYCLNAHNSLMKIVPLLSRVTFRHGSYEDQDIPMGAVVYCDPPYAGTTSPGAGGPFNHDTFWAWAASMNESCFVSEYSAPESFTEVWQKDVKTDMHTTSGKAQRVEKLFVNHTS